MEVDPYIVDGEVPTVEHEVVLPGIAIVPVTPVGAGLIPGDASSVAPRGMPVGETVEPVPKPSGDVAPILGVGVAIVCAMQTLQTKSVGSTAAIREDLIRFLRVSTASLRRAQTSVNLSTRISCEAIGDRSILVIALGFPVIAIWYRRIYFGIEGGGVMHLEMRQERLTFDFSSSMRAARATS